MRNVTIKETGNIYRERLCDQWGSYNTSRRRRCRRQFADDILKCIFLNENVWISIKVSLKFIPKCPINNIPALVQIMARRLPGAKPLSEPMMVRSLTHVCATQPQWVINTYELLHPRALKISTFYKNRTFQCTDKIFCLWNSAQNILPYNERYIFYWL